MKNYKFKICGLDCANCANKLESALSKLDLINNVSISFITEKLFFDCDESNIDEVLNDIKKVVKKEEPDVYIEEI